MNINSNLCRFLFIILMILTSSNMLSADDNSTCTLTVVISSFQNSEGNAMVAVSNSSESYEQGPEGAFAKKMAKVENALARLVFNDLPYGEYAVSLYHDQNSNGKMDKNSMGIPKEPYAFSNNARGMFGKPDWEKVSFELNSPENHVDINFK